MTTGANDFCCPSHNGFSFISNTFYWPSHNGFSFISRLKAQARAALQAVSFTTSVFLLLELYFLVIDMIEENSNTIVMLVMQSIKQKVEECKFGFINSESCYRL